MTERDIQLLRGGIACLVGEERLRQAISRYKFNHEVYIHRIGASHHAMDALERFLGAVGEVVTLHDVAQRSREEIARVKGVGPKSMEKLDAAMAVEGLSWAEKAS